MKEETKIDCNFSCIILKAGSQAGLVITAWNVFWDVWTSLPSRFNVKCAYFLSLIQFPIWYNHNRKSRSFQCNLNILYDKSHLILLQLFSKTTVCIYFLTKLICMQWCAYYPYNQGNWLCQSLAHSVCDLYYSIFFHVGFIMVRFVFCSW